MSSDDIIRGMRSLAQVNEALIQASLSVGRTEGVRNSYCAGNMRLEAYAEDRFGWTVGHGPGFSFDWWLEIELVSGYRMTFGVELSWHPPEWQIWGWVKEYPNGEEEIPWDLPDVVVLNDADAMLTKLDVSTQLILEQGRNILAARLAGGPYLG